MTVGLDAAASGILADEAELDTTAQNLSNTQTPGYATETVALDPFSPTGPDGVGEGVSVGAVTQTTSPLYEQLNLIAQGGVGAANEAATVANAAQQAFPEPSSSGLQAQLSQLWTDMSTLASSPSNSAASTSVVQDLQTVTNTLNSTYSTLTTTQNQLAQELNGGASSGGGLLGQVNGLLSQISQLNVGIVAGSSGGLNTNALMDQQRNDLTQLAGIMSIRTNTEASGVVDVYAGSISLVQGTLSTSLQLTGTANANNLAVQTAAGAPVQAGGQIGAILTGVNATIPSYLTQLSGISDSLATTLNGLQSAGVSANGTPGPTSAAAAGWPGATLPPIFVNGGSPTTYTTGPTSAASITVSPALLANPSLLATGAGSVPAGVSNIDPTTIQQMAALGQSGAGPDVLYQQLVGNVGTIAQAAQANQTNAQGLATSTSNNLSSTEGVNTDEQTIDLLNAQRDYQAMAQVINAMNTSLQALLSDV